MTDQAKSQAAKSTRTPNCENAKVTGSALVVPFPCIEPVPAIVSNRLSKVLDGLSATKSTITIAIRVSFSCLWRASKSSTECSRWSKLHPTVIISGFRSSRKPKRRGNASALRLRVVRARQRQVEQLKMRWCRLRLSQLRIIMMEMQQVLVSSNLSYRMKI